MCELGTTSLLYQNVLFRDIYNGLGRFFPHWACAADFFIAGFTIMFIIVNSVLLGAAIFTWGERRLLGRFQSRLGPNRWGPFGLLQPIADLLKLLLKEDIIPSMADKLVFSLAPVLMLAPVILTMAVVPFAKNTLLADLNIGILFIVGVSSMSILAIFMAGWSSANKYAMFGAMRGVAQLISYEIPVVLSLAAVVLLVGSMSLLQIADSQKNVVYLLVQPLGALVFLLGASAEMNRTPFDIVEAESEIIAGYHIEYSGIKFALFQAAEFGATLVNSAIMANVFLGGWSGPFLSGQLGAVWFLLKLLFFVFLFVWIRATLPRLRIDQIMAFAWKFLFPLSLINLVATAAEVYVFGVVAGEGLSTGELWAMAAINFAIAFITIPLFGNMIRDKLRVPRRVAAPTAAPGAVPEEAR